MTVGSSPNIEVHLADSGIARFHARIIYKNGRHYIQTLERRGSCLVNGVKTKKAELKDGDILSFGRVKMQVEYAHEAHA
jgi:predicted component of type VI protein secretion system